jgi:hypothetical protein
MPDARHCPKISTSTAAFAIRDWAILIATPKVPPLRRHRASETPPPRPLKCRWGHNLVPDLHAEAMMLGEVDPLPPGCLTFS